MRGSTVYQALFEADARMLADRDAEVADLQLQFSVDTATWALSIYEAELGIVTDSMKPISERRALIKSKMRGSGKVDAAMLKLVVSSWTGGTIDVSFEDSTITITFIDVIGIPENVGDVQFAIEEIKPAHLAVLYVFLYNTWQQAASKTWGELASYTWDQVMAGDIF